MNTPCLLIGDIGGTNARFALVGEDGAYGGEQGVLCADFPGVEQAIHAFLRHTGAPAPTVICLAAAGPIVGEQIKLTNNPWLIDSGSLGRAFSGANVCLLNDFEAVAFALPHLRPCDVQVLGDHPLPDLANRDFGICVMVPGTGLGAGGLRRYKGHEVPLVTEAGHVGCAPENPLQAEIWSRLQDRFGRVSDERLVSGSGLPDLYGALAEITGESFTPIDTPEIFRRDAQGETLAVRTLDIFFEVLGQAAGNLVLSMGAFDGAFIAGGILPRYVERTVTSSFRRGFENKGRHRRLLEPVPSLLVTHSQPGLLGAGIVARRLHEHRNA